MGLLLSWIVAEVAALLSAPFVILGMRHEPRRITAAALLSFLCSLPGMLLLLEFCLRWLRTAWEAPGARWPYYLSAGTPVFGTAVGVSVIVGPLLLIASAVLWPGDRSRALVQLVRVVHAVAWGLSGAVIVATV